ncbi:hypothetical protein GF351_04510 [Candidatus Woesearchaeota archaeon]|nr:hypothetical protein [Candidatus Woesearchaeota archaeon]
MGGRSYIILLMILFLHFLGVIFLIFELTGTEFLVQMFLFSFLMIISFITLYGILQRRRWAWISAMFLFAVNLMNVMMLYFLLNSMLTIFSTVLVVDVIGFVISVISITPNQGYDLNLDVPPPSSESSDIEVEEIRPYRIQAYDIDRPDYASKEKESLSPHNTEGSHRKRDSRTGHESKADGLTSFSDVIDLDAAIGKAGSTGRKASKTGRDTGRKSSASRSRSSSRKSSAKRKKSKAKASSKSRKSKTSGKTSSTSGKKAKKGAKKGKDRKKPDRDTGKSRKKARK